MMAAKGLAMEKWLCFGSMGVGFILLVLFALDLIMGMASASFLPFSGMSTVLDIILILASGLLIYLGWDAYRDIR
ncbi:MAG: hypothetical protein ACK4RK_21425 [Gemmataceae bacterium]